MKKTMTALVAGIMFVALSLTGCSLQGKQLSDVQKISYISYCGDNDCGTVLVITADRKVKQYYITLDYKYTDLFAGKLPSEDDYRNRLEYEITEDEWNALINTINENNFADLPEELPEGESTFYILDGSTRYMQVETADGVHKSGGYAAGDWDDEENKRFGAIKDKINEIIINHSSQPEE